MARYNQLSVGKLEIENVGANQGKGVFAITTGDITVGTTAVTQAIAVKAGTRILDVMAYVVTGAGETATVDIGLTGGDTYLFLNELNVETAGAAQRLSSEAAAGSYLFTADDTIDVVAASGTTWSAVINLTVICCKG